MTTGAISAEILRGWRRRYTNTIAGSVAPFMRARGFRKTRLLWVRDLGEVAHCVQIERSSKVPPDTIHMYLWFGVYVFGVGDVWSEIRIGEKPSQLAAPLRSTPKQLSENRVSGAWFVDYPAGEASARSAGEKYLSQIEDIGLPWLEWFRTARAVAEYLVDPAPGPGRIRTGYREIPQNSLDLADAAACYLVAGDVEKALYWADVALEAARGAEFRVNQQAFRDRLEQLVREGRFPRR